MLLSNSIPPVSYTHLPISFPPAGSNPALSSGPAVVPLLKAGFDPAGGKEMVRRVEILAELDTDNAWIVAQLDAAQKEVREALILALGRHSENAPLLRDLVNSEKGKARKAALWSLAQMDDAQTVTFWTKEAVSYTHLSGTVSSIISRSDSGQVGLTSSPLPSPL